MLTKFCSRIFLLNNAIRDTVFQTFKIIIKILPVCFLCPFSVESVSEKVPLQIRSVPDPGCLSQYFLSSKIGTYVRIKLFFKVGDQNQSFNKNSYSAISVPDPHTVRIRIRMLLALMDPHPDP
jgi:hypothetical protein